MSLVALATRPCSPISETSCLTYCSGPSATGSLILAPTCGRVAKDVRKTYQAFSVFSDDDEIYVRFLGWVFRDLLRIH